MVDLSSAFGGAAFPRPRSGSGRRVVDLTAGATTRPLLIVHSSDDMYGADKMVLEVIAALPPRDRDRVVVWLPDDYEHGLTPLCQRLAEEGIPCEHMSLPIVRRRYLNPAGLSALGARAFDARRRIAQLDPSEIILATSAALPLAPFIKRSTRARVVLHMQEVWQGREAQVLGALANKVDAVVAISEAARASLPDQVRDKAIVVPNGTRDPGPSTPLAEHAGELVFVMASRWNVWKGHEVLLQAWDAAGCPGTLLVLGGPPAMGTSVDVPSMVQRSRKPESVRILGEVVDLRAVMDAADVMVVPSTSPEPFGLVTIEAFALGRPVIASAHGGLLETVQDGSGWLFEPGNVEDLAELMRSVTREDVVVAGGRARDRFERLYSSEAFGRALRDALGWSEGTADESPWLEESRVGLVPPGR